MPRPFIGILFCRDSGNGPCAHHAQGLGHMYVFQCPSSLYVVLSASAFEVHGDDRAIIAIIADRFSDDRAIIAIIADRVSGHRRNVEFNGKRYRHNDDRLRS